MSHAAAPVESFKPLHGANIYQTPATHVQQISAAFVD